MKISSVSWLALGAGLALCQGVLAAPIRLTIVTHQEWMGNSVGGDSNRAGFRFGHAMAVPAAPGVRKAGCHMRPSKGGRLSVGDVIRHALGLPPVEHEHHRGRHPAPPPSVHPEPMFAMPIHHESKIISVQAPPHAIAIDEPFLRRVHAALLTLGKWEARAVAFVLGCGIGVLLRMVWVFFVLIFRGIRDESSNTADTEYTLVLAHVDEALPKYADQVEDAAPAYVNEKTELPAGA